METNLFTLCCQLAFICIIIVALFIVGLMLNKPPGNAPLNNKPWRPYKKKIICRDDDQPYLIRYTLCNWKIFSIKVHNILLSDPSCLHDHPWAFITVLLRGSYTEHTPSGSKIYSAGNILYRRAEYQHCLEINKPVWSFVITFKKTRTWGFYTKHGWVNWKLYTSDNRCD